MSAERATTIEEALGLAGEILDGSDGAVETLIDRGCDVIEALRAEVRRLRVKCGEAEVE